MAHDPAFERMDDRRRAWIRCLETAVREGLESGPPEFLESIEDIIAEAEAEIAEEKSQSGPSIPP